jgi:hypothetical protein
LLLRVDYIFMDGGMKRLLHLARGARKFDYDSAI